MGYPLIIYKPGDLEHEASYVCPLCGTHYESDAEAEYCLSVCSDCGVYVSAWDYENGGWY